jgi:hypothetical protein
VPLACCILRDGGRDICEGFGANDL